MIWKNTRQVGFGMAKGRSGKVVIVANYLPAGNIIGQFMENILPPLSSQESANFIPTGYNLKRHRCVVGAISFFSCAKTDVPVAIKRTLFLDLAIDSFLGITFSLLRFTEIVFSCFFFPILCNRRIFIHRIDSTYLDLNTQFTYFDQVFTVFFVMILSFLFSLFRISLISIGFTAYFSTK